jgi:hypothetical protein
MPTPMDVKETLTKDQHPSTAADVAKIKNLPKREGIGPPAYITKPNTVKFLDRDQCDNTRNS